MGESTPRKFGNSLEKAFYSYVELVGRELPLRDSAGNSTKILRLIPNSHHALRQSVDELEASKCFLELIEKTVEFKAPKTLKSKPNAYAEWERAAKNFFRRSGFYKAVADMNDFDKIKINVYERYVKAVKSEESTIIYLAPIEYVNFSENRMDFGSFEVRRFSKDELKRLLEIESNELFYEHALIGLGELQWYWFVVVKSKKPRNSRRLLFDAVDFGKVKPSFTEFPNISGALTALVSYHWQTDLAQGRSGGKDWEGWTGFDIPFVLRIDDDLLSHPQSRVPLERLALEDMYDSSTGEYRFDPSTGKVIKGPIVFIYLDDEESAEFRAFVANTVGELEKFNSVSEWKFFELAGQYLIKAFFAEGLEQLLWHVTVIDALLGERGLSTDQLATRIATVMGRDKKQHKRLFKDLYDFRSRYVHGDAMSKQVMKGHLRQAREMARSLFVWFTAFLSHILKSADDPDSSLPTRQQLLKLIDSDLMTLTKFARTLPDEFPSVEGWLP